MASATSDLDQQSAQDTAAARGFDAFVSYSHAADGRPAPAAPEALWELSLGIYCTVWGFRPESPILQPDARDRRIDVMPAATPA